MNNSLNTKRGLTRSRRSRSSAVAPFLTRLTGEARTTVRCPGGSAPAPTERASTHGLRRGGPHAGTAPQACPQHGTVTCAAVCSSSRLSWKRLQRPPPGTMGRLDSGAVSSDCQNEAALHTRTQDDPENTVYGTKQKQVQMLESAVFNGRTAAAVTTCGTAGRPCEHARELSARSF